MTPRTCRVPYSGIIIPRVLVQSGILTPWASDKRWVEGMTTVFRKLYSLRPFLPQNMFTCAMAIS